jgi:nicotinamide-nucleotide amidase
MRAMFEQSVAPHIARGTGETIVHRTLQTFGMSESEVGQRIADLMQRGRNPTVGTSAADLVISIHVHAHASSQDQANRMASADAAQVRSRLGLVVFGEGDDTLQQAVGRMLMEQRKTVSAAESCTGGLITKRLTDVPGSSAYLTRSYVTYSNDAKHRLLGVEADLIGQHGAVSAPVAEAMAANCRRISGTDFALSATGIAGPTGATPAKPMGLVYVALAEAAKTVVKELRLGETLMRAEVRDRTAKAALNLLRLRLLET